MYLQLSNYHYANEILYVLKSVNNDTNKVISKIGVQKLLYLSASLSPIKDIVLSIVKFISEKRGPYSKDIQNTLDHLVAYDLVKITEYRVFSNHSSIAFYQITEGGLAAIDSLIHYNKEEEVYWWINLITRISNLYVDEDEMKSENHFSGMDKIVKLVYQDPTFKSIREHQGKYALIDLNIRNGLTYDLVRIAKNFIIENESNFDSLNERNKVELIVLSFFEFLFSNYLSEASL
jgi:hypothetical protein